MSKPRMQIRQHYTHLFVLILPNPLPPFRTKINYSDGTPPLWVCNPSIPSPPLPHHKKGGWIAYPNYLNGGGSLWRLKAKRGSETVSAPAVLLGGNRWIASCSGGWCWGNKSTMRLCFVFGVCHLGLLLRSVVGEGYQVECLQFIYGVLFFFFNKQ